MQKKTPVHSNKALLADDNEEHSTLRQVISNRVTWYCRLLRKQKVTFWNKIFRDLRDNKKWPNESVFMPRTHHANQATHRAGRLYQSLGGFVHRNSAITLLFKKLSIKVLKLINGEHNAGEDKRVSLSPNDSWKNSNEASLQGTFPPWAQYTALNPLTCFMPALCSPFINFNKSAVYCAQPTDMFYAMSERGACLIIILNSWF